MPVLDRESFFNRVHIVIGNDTSDESISFLEDMTDTYNDLEKKTKNNGEDWEKKYKELDESWKAKYRHRFLNSDGGEYYPERKEEKEEVKEVTIEDLFTNKKEEK